MAFCKNKKAAIDDLYLEIYAIEGFTTGYHHFGAFSLCVFDYLCVTTTFYDMK